MSQEQLESLVARSRQVFTPPIQEVEVRESGEALLSREEIEAAGLRCEPFWESQNDLEGDAYHEYIAQHPSFNLSLRSQAVERLIAAQAALPPEWQLVLKAGYRPMAVQQDLVRRFRASALAQHPTFTAAQAYAHAQLYVSDPTLVAPPHVSGGAVDLDVYYRQTNQPVDLGCPPNTDAPIAWIHSTELTDSQYQHRLTLLRVMLAAGFAPLATEWWHFQYGEQRWAHFYGYSHAPYGLLLEPMNSF